MAQPEINPVLRVWNALNDPDTSNVIQQAAEKAVLTPESVQNSIAVTDELYTDIRAKLPGYPPGDVDAMIRLALNLYDLPKSLPRNDELHFEVLVRKAGLQHEMTRLALLASAENASDNQIRAMFAVFQNLSISDSEYIKRLHWNSDLRQWLNGFRTELGLTRVLYANNWTTFFPSGINRPMDEKNEILTLDMGHNIDMALVAPSGQILFVDAKTQPPYEFDQNKGLLRSANVEITDETDPFVIAELDKIARATANSTRTSPNYSQRQVGYAQIALPQHNIGDWVIVGKMTPEERQDLGYQREWLRKLNRLAPGAEEKLQIGLNHVLQPENATAEPMHFRQADRAWQSRIYHRE